MSVICFPLRKLLRKSCWLGVGVVISVSSQIFFNYITIRTSPMVLIYEANHQLKRALRTWSIYEGYLSAWPQFSMWI